MQTTNYILPCQDYYLPLDYHTWVTTSTNATEVFDCNIKKVVNGFLVELYGSKYVFESLESLFQFVSKEFTKK